MLTALRGVTQLVMGGEWIMIPEGHALRFFGTGRPLGVDVCIWTTVGAICLVVFLERYLPLGRQIYAAGSNPEAAKTIGLPVRRIKVFAFALTGFLTAVATIVSVTRLSVIESGTGVSFELLVVTCVVVGGTAITGGQGKTLGAILAVLLLGTIGSVLIFMRMGEMATYWERAIQGAFILGAVLLDHLRNRGEKTA
ncbi:ABC transporter permease [Candidatus Hydrogenedentota bacterium]